MWRAAIFAVVGCTQLPRAIAGEPLCTRGTCMGTTYAVTIVDQIDNSSFNEIANRINNELERIEHVFSLYRPTSELSRFNEASSSNWIDVSSDLLLVTKHAIELSRQTNGAFDPTIAPLIRLWRLHRASNDWSPPTAAALAESRKRVAFHLLELRNDPPAIRKRMTGVELDLNALVEGWAIDRVIDLLQQHGISNVLVELGGEFRAIGHKSEGQPWKIGIENPFKPTSLYATASLRNAALATSGNYRQVIEYNGRRYGHILDARTGEPVEHDLIAVSVLAIDATTADGWATALMTLGSSEGMALAEKKELAASFALRAGHELQIKLTTRALSKIVLAEK